MVHMIPRCNLTLGDMSYDSIHIYSCAWWVTSPVMVTKKFNKHDLRAFTTACMGGIVFW